MSRMSLLAILAIALLGCNRPMPPGPAKKGTIGVSVLTLTNPFFKVIGETITDELGKHGYDVIVLSGDENINQQQNQVKDFLVRKVAAIVLCPCDSKAIGPVIQEANKQGVPVFTADIACLAPGAKVETHVATDNYAGGKQAGVAMIEALGEAGGKVAILDFKQAQSGLMRLKGLQDALRANNHDPKSGT